jgi:hypothetical protein
MTKQERIEALKDRIRELTDSQVERAVFAIGGNTPLLSEEMRLVRACLLDIIEERHGEDRMDLVMDQMGML